MLACLVLEVGTATAGPFGLDKGASRSALADYGPEPASEVRLLRTPCHPEDGLCKIVAMSPPISTSVYGSELKSEFESIRDALTAKYGTGEIQGQG